jgi:two-component system, OmpR family, sensor histidine kinase VicK
LTRDISSGFYIEVYRYLFEAKTIHSQNNTAIDEKTEVFYGGQNVVRKVLQFISNTKRRFDVCIDHTRPSLVFEIQEIKESLLACRDSGIRIRVLTEVTKDNISYCKELITIVDELRHLDGIKGNFYVNETEYLVPASFHDKGKPALEIIYSNVGELVEHQQYVFDMVWNKAIPAEQKITEIGEGIEAEFIETIMDPVKLQIIALKHIQSATEEMLIIFSTANAFYRQLVLKGGMRLCKEAAERNVKIRILTPRDDQIDKVVQELLQERQEGKQRQQQRGRIDIRYIEPSLQTKVTVLIIDRKYCFIVELKDDTKDNSDEAIGLATYANSKPTVLSYASIFESFWRQTELYEQSKDQLHAAEGELSNMKEYLNEVLKEVSNMRNKQI